MLLLNIVNGTSVLAKCNRPLLYAPSQRSRRVHASERRSRLHHRIHGRTTQADSLASIPQWKLGKKGIYATHTHVGITYKPCLALLG
jgi:hypothetical protein